MRNPVVLPRKYHELTVVDLQDGESGYVSGNALRANNHNGELHIEDSTIVDDEANNDKPVLVTRYHQGFVVLFPETLRVPIGVTSTSNWLPVIDYKTY